jgi:hypothetical protein
VEANGNLYVVYTSEKHHCVLTTIPLTSLAADAAVSATAPRLAATHGVTSGRRTGPSGKHVVVDYYDIVAKHKGD